MSKEKQANQWFSDPRQELFLKAYLDPKSPTWGNALQSGLGAGYSREYSESITAQMPDWLSERLGKSKLVQKAEKNMELALEGALDDPEKGKKELQYKASEFILKTQGKELGYTERTELTGKDGEKLIENTLTQEEKDKLLGLLR